MNHALLFMNRTIQSFCFSFNIETWCCFTSMMVTHSYNNTHLYLICFSFLFNTRVVYYFQHFQTIQFFHLSQRIERFPKKKIHFIFSIRISKIFFLSPGFLIQQIINIIYSETFIFGINLYISLIIC